MMGIYLPNMEMPKNHNHVTITIWSNGAASYALHDRGESFVDFRNVEVVPVPEHGDLIDREALTAAICSRLCIKDLTYLSPAEKAIVDEINDAPVVIPAEEGE